MDALVTQALGESAQFAPQRAPEGSIALALLRRHRRHEELFKAQGMAGLYHDVAWKASEQAIRVCNRAGHWLRVGEIPDVQLGGDELTRQNQARVRHA